ncbi:heme-binding protein [Pseudomonas sp. ZM23]|uniref:Heme-binding protein n=1 Tax=Pseudomonas triclosanedens TaxID=2961893 RepID=A0ABY6ZRP9_9PSED|nr:heme-binding protein [Pseudomonas triclosanedens]MCP8467500.1 heme-binding protein [Pseudomonas triclosanedens]MCP8471677.1 heme-binding protein [Pseudomonas triclosanedens]MCP8478970.1 heme-binding protein [Pseudomonas triclosanedens]WAI47036.1 heme-binding protein [Pseudomonas triclosanedens]
MLLDRKSLSLQLAMEASQAALDRARELGIRVSIAVCDAGGHLIHLAHMDGVPAHTREIAIDKAYTSACFGFSTSLWAARLDGMSRMVLEGLASRPRMILFGGGVPVLVDGCAVGAVGVSGGSELEDVVCAEAGVQQVVDRLGVDARG